MQAIDNEIETIHLYVMRGEEKQPSVMLPVVVLLLWAAATLSGAVYMALHPYHEHATLTVPAQLLPLRTFQASAGIVPTGVRFYPATYAHGFLTFSNGSVIGQSIPQGFTIDGAATDQAVYVPPASADGFGATTVPAHLLTPGTNKAALAIHEVIGASLFIRNLSPFTGAQAAHSVTFETPADRALAASKARDRVVAQVSGMHYPCVETVSGAVTVTWRCQFVSYHVPSYMHVTSVRIAGENLIVSVWFVPQPKPIYRK